MQRVVQSVHALALAGAPTPVSLRTRLDQGLDAAGLHFVWTSGLTYSSYASTLLLRHVLIIKCLWSSMKIPNTVLSVRDIS